MWNMGQQQQLGDDQAEGQPQIAAVIRFSNWEVNHK
jgi:hypothetical protein